MQDLDQKRPFHVPCSRTELPVCGVNWTIYWYGGSGGLTFDSVGSEHRVVATRLHLSLRVPKSAPRPRPDWEAFAGRSELEANYTAEVRARMHLLAEEGEPTTDMQFVSANKEAPRK